MKLVSINQPHYFPWLGLLDKIYRSDCFIVLDSVQYNKRGFQNRALYSIKNNKKWLTLPVYTKGYQQIALRIDQVKLAVSDAPAKHFEVLRHRYHKAPGWQRIESQLKEIMHRQTESLLDIVMKTMKLTLSVFEIERPIFFASSFKPIHKKTMLMLELTQAVGASSYLSGVGAKAYMNEDIFKKKGVSIFYQNFHHPSYMQLQSASFQKNCFALEWYLEDPDGAVEKFHLLAQSKHGIESNEH